MPLKQVVAYFRGLESPQRLVITGESRLLAFKPCTSPLCDPQDLPPSSTPTAQDAALFGCLNPSYVQGHIRR